MEEENKSPVGELLFEHYLLYQQKNRRAITQKYFAKYIGIDETLYNHIYKGRRKPNRQIVAHLAEFFDDLRFYDVAGEPRPDPNLFYVQRNWESIPNAIKKQIADVVAKYMGSGKGK